MDNRYKQILYKSIQMTNDGMKRCSTSWIITRMHIRDKWNITHSKRIAEIKQQNTDNTKWCQGCGTNGTFTHHCENIKWYSHFGKNSLAVSYQVKMAQLCNQAIQFLNVYSREMKICL